MTWENRLIFEVSSADPDADVPNWVDLTSRINDMLQPIEVNIGRQNDLDQTEPTNWSLVLNNADDALTYGNTASPYPWWGPGRKCRLREQIGATIIPLATGYLQVPTETVALAGVDQTVSVSIVDRLGRLAASEPFISTLAAYIRYTHAATLAAYWPLGGSTIQFDRSYFDVIAASRAFITSNTADVAASFNPSDGAVAPADDLDCLGLVPGADGYYVITGPGTSLAAGQVLTIAGWYRPSSAGNLTIEEFMNAGIVENAGTSSLAIFAASGFLTAQMAFGALTGTINSGIAVPVDVSTPIAIRYGYDPSVFEMWVGGQRVTGVLAGAPPTSSSIAQLTFGNFSYGGRLGHLQVHVGAAAAFDFTAFAAQQNMGLTGLQRQTTGDRIRTIARYAGIPNAEFANTVDTGTSVMQAAQLAGRTPLEAMREAETTEQGLLYVDGSGNLVFKDRRTLYNI